MPAEVAVDDAVDDAVDETAVMAWVDATDDVAGTATEEVWVED